MNRVEGRVDAVEARIKVALAEAIRDLETKLIGEFWKWGRTSDMRTRESLGQTNALSERTAILSNRLVAIEDRVTDLERKRA